MTWTPLMRITVIAITFVIGEYLSRATKGYDEVKYMAIRWASNLHNGQNATSLIGVYKVPNDIIIDKNVMQNYDEQKGIKDL